jgi:hypothetical protein
MLAALNLGACATRPLSPFTTDTPPLMLVPASQVGVEDRRGRFREIFCEVLEARGTALPDYRPCNQALVRVGTEPAGSGREVELGYSSRQLVVAIVPGLGWDCFANWLDVKGTAVAHIRQFGYDHAVIKVDGLSGSANNARQIRDAILQMPLAPNEPHLVLVGYSKGAVDILDAVVSYPEIRGRVAAVVSAAGSIGGSPLANDVEHAPVGLLTRWPGAECSGGDGGAMESLRPTIRKAWLAENALPKDIRYYSLVTFPDPERISALLQPSYSKLSQVDARNDSQLLFYDQVIPGSKLLGYMNADHWALAVPIARSHPALGATFVNHNDFPREALVEALLRFIEEDLSEADN